METGKVEQTAVNEGRTSDPIDTRLTQRRSGAVQGYTLLSRHGLVAGVYRNMDEVRDAAARLFPGEEQDDECEGKGWDVEVIREDLPAASRASHCS